MIVDGTCWKCEEIRIDWRVDDIRPADVLFDFTKKVIAILHDLYFTCYRSIDDNWYWYCHIVVIRCGYCYSSLLFMITDYSFLSSIVIIICIVVYYHYHFTRTPIYTFSVEASEPQTQGDAQTRHCSSKGFTWHWFQTLHELLNSP